MYTNVYQQSLQQDGFQDLCCSATPPALPRVVESPPALDFEPWRLGNLNDDKIGIIR